MACYSQKRRDAANSLIEERVNTHFSALNDLVKLSTRADVGNIVLVMPWYMVEGTVLIRTSTGRWSEKPRHFASEVCVSWMRLLSSSAQPGTMASTWRTRSTTGFNPSGSIPQRELSAIIFSGCDLANPWLRLLRWRNAARNRWPIHSQRTILSGRRWKKSWFLSKLTDGRFTSRRPVQRVKGFRTRSTRSVPSSTTLRTSRMTLMPERHPVGIFWSLWTRHCRGNPSTLSLTRSKSRRWMATSSTPSWSLSWTSCRVCLTGGCAIPPIQTHVC